MVKFIYQDGSEEITDRDGLNALRWAAQLHTGLVGIKVFGLTIKSEGVYHCFRDVEFINCTFIDVGFKLCEFHNVTLRDCKISNDELNNQWIDKVTVVGRKNARAIKETYKTNEQIAKESKAKKVESIENRRYVRVTFECDFCHREYQSIQHRNMVSNPLKSVPNTRDRFVCDDCYEHYDLRTKIMGNRTYGYHGPLSFYKTPMDSRNTAILGLEMEFEGDFRAWKELQDAHKGCLHYGYDTSVIGQNELSWDCGSYSWWKYLSPLKDVCAALRKGGGHAGDSAGIHIHVSRQDTNVERVVEAINQACRTGVWRTIMDSVSLRNDKEKYERYSNLSEDKSQHHAGISHNEHNTCEFRIFASSTDADLILKRLRFCKEIYNLFADNSDKPKTELIPMIEDNTVKFILKCAKIQLDKGFITPTAYHMMVNALTKGAKKCA